MSFDIASAGADGLGLGARVKSVIKGLFSPFDLIFILILALLWQIG